MTANRSHCPPGEAYLSRWCIGSLGSDSNAIGVPWGIRGDFRLVEERRACKDLCFLKPDILKLCLARAAPSVAIASLEQTGTTERGRGPHAKIPSSTKGVSRVSGSDGWSWLRVCGTITKASAVTRQGVLPDLMTATELHPCRGLQNGLSGK